jgi:outer membrane lipoprotein-sorting protein
MSPLRSRALRWIAPLGAAAVVAGAAAGVPALSAGASPALPRLTTQQLLVKVQHAHVSGLSGTVRVSVDLGLPQLPSSGSSDASVQSMLTGTHTLSVALAGPQRQRIGIHGSLEETELVHNGSNVWVYRSTADRVDHLILPAHSQAADSPAMPPGATSGAADLTPQALAKKALAAITPSTRVTTDQQTTIAGRPAYELRLAPRSAASLIDHVSIAVDGRTGVPLGVTVDPRGTGKPALDVAFTSVSFAAPAASTFEFTAPPGAKVTERTMSAMRPRMRQHTAEPAAQRPTAIGTGWGSVVEMHGVSLSDLTATSAQSGSSVAAALVRSGRQVSGAYGTGTLWTSRLLTVLITSDGRLFAGAVTPQAIERAAAGHPAAGR